MFYKTQIKSVTDGAAFDVTGRRLSFVGYLPVKAGDTVFTDGKVIFGNAPPKGSPAVFDDVPSAIPVLAVGTDNNELRGYFDLRGKFKKYKIKGADWIVNAKKIYKHDTDTNIIDAEIAHDEQGNEIGVYTVEKVITQNGSDDDFYYRFYNSRGEAGDVSILNVNPRYKGETRAYVFLDRFNVADFDKSGENVVKDCEIIIKKDGDEIFHKRLFDILPDFENEAKNYVNVNLPQHVPTDYIKSRACLWNFKILPNGSWEALVWYGVWAERDFSTIQHSINYQVVRSSHETREEPIEGDNSIWGIVRKAEFIVKNEIIDIENTEPQQSGPKEGDAFYSTTAYLRYLVKISSGGDITVLARSQNLTPLQMTEYGSENSKSSSFERNTDKESFPYIHVTRATSVYRGEIITTSYYSQSALIYETVNDENWELYYLYSFEVYWDSRNLPNAPDYDKVIVDVADEFTFPVQDGYHAKFKNAGYVNSWRFGGIYLGDKQLFGDVTEYYISYKGNLSFAALKADKFLFGIHEDSDHDIDGALYKINQDGNVELLADRLKNFRLRELKKISNAKK